VSDRDIVTVYDPEATLESGTGVVKPPLGFNMSGCSGGPAPVVQEVKRLFGGLPVGLIFKRAGEKAGGGICTLSRIPLRRIDFIQEDGSLKEPETGWLPR